jgi:hypothetical protein
VEIGGRWCRPKGGTAGEVSWVMRLRRSPSAGQSLSGPKETFQTPLVNFLETDIFANATMGNIDPLMVPPDAPIGADVAHLEAVRVFDRWLFVGHLPGGGFIAGGGGAHVEHLVRPLAGVMANPASGKALWQEPQLALIEPKLTKHGKLEEVTAGFFGGFMP